jgi:hypothetical protein
MLRRSSALLILALVFSPACAQQHIGSAVPPHDVPHLPTTWWIISNGVLGLLNVSSIDAQGNMDGTWEEPPTGNRRTDQVKGLWNASTRKLTFIRIIQLGNPLGMQIYTGYLMDSGAVWGPTGEQHLTGLMMTGVFEAFSGAGGTAQRSVFGWVAAQFLPD